MVNSKANFFVEYIQIFIDFKRFVSAYLLFFIITARTWHLSFLSAFSVVFLYVDLQILQ